MVMRQDNWRHFSGQRMTAALFRPHCSEAFTRDLLMTNHLLEMSPNGRHCLYPVTESNLKPAPRLTAAAAAAPDTELKQQVSVRQPCSVFRPKRFMSKERRGRSFTAQQVPITIEGCQILSQTKALCSDTAQGSHFSGVLVVCWHHLSTFICTVKCRLCFNQLQNSPEFPADCCSVPVFIKQNDEPLFSAGMCAFYSYASE